MGAEASSGTVLIRKRRQLPTLLIVHTATIDPRWKQRHRRTRFQGRSFGVISADIISPLGPM